MSWWAFYEKEWISSGGAMENRALGFDDLTNDGKSPFLMGKSPFLMGKSSFLMENHNF